MKPLVDSPVLVFAGSLLAQWLAAFAGDALRGRKVSQAEWDDFNVVKTTALTLLALIIGFAFSMAVNRYDTRKTLEEAEANAIGTEFARAQLLPAAQSKDMRNLLRKYVDDRLAFYAVDDDARLKEIESATTVTQDRLWATAVAAANASPTPITALVVAGMNDVLNAQGYTQAAWRNRIPRAAWMLMMIVAIACNIMLGYGEKNPNRANLLLLPIVMSIAFVFIADIEAPRGGFIRVHPDNLIAFQASLPGD